MSPMSSNQTQHPSSVIKSSHHMQINVLSMDTVPASHLYPSGKPRETQCTWLKKVLGSPITHDNTSDDFMGFTQFQLNHIIPAQMPHRWTSSHWHSLPHSSEEPTIPQNTDPSPFCTKVTRDSSQGSSSHPTWAELLWWPHQPVLAHILAWG